MQNLFNNFLKNMNNINNKIVHKHYNMMIIDLAWLSIVGILATIIVEICYLSEL